VRHLIIRGIAFVAIATCACAESSITTLDDPTAQIPRPTASRALSLELCAFGQPFTMTAQNPYVPLAVGSVWEYRGEEDGALIELRIEVLKKTERVGGVETLVLQETEWEDYELIERSWNYFAYVGGTLCYFGEAVDIYEDGKVVSHEGAWRADDWGHPGIFMPADPMPGTGFQMEVAPGIAEDEGLVLGSGPYSVEATTFPDVIRIRETSPLGGSTIKYYARDVGLIVDGPLELVSFTLGGAR